MAVEQYQEGHDPSVAPPTVADIFGTLAAYLIFLALAQFLWIDLVEMSSGNRAALLVGLGLLGLRGAAAGIGPDQAGRPRAPGTARALGLLSWVIFGLALFELGRAYHLPSSGWSQVVLGGAALFAAQALSHGLLALTGASMIHGNLSYLVALQLGLAGSWATNAIFVNMGVGLIQLLVGRWRIRVGARTSGVALVGWGGSSLLLGAYMLSVFGGGYLGDPDSWVVLRTSQALFAVTALGFLRLGKRTGSTLLQVTAAVLLLFRVMVWYVDVFGELTERAFLLAMGTLFLVLAFRSDRTSEDSASGPEARAEGGPACRRFGLALARRAMVALIAVAAMRGAYNSQGWQREALIPVEGPVMAPFLLLQVPATEVPYPKGVRPGEALDVHVEVEKAVTYDAAYLLPSGLEATRRGEPAQGSLDPSRTLIVPGVLVRGWFADGVEFERVLALHRPVMEVPKGVAFDAVAGRHLVMRTGRAGYLYPYELRKPGDGGDLVAELGSWLLGRAP